jgi:hypothetical protein
MSAPRDSGFLRTDVLSPPGGQWSAEFERPMALGAIRGVKVVKDEKVNPKRRLWLLRTALQMRFRRVSLGIEQTFFPQALASITD